MSFIPERGPGRLSIRSQTEGCRDLGILRLERSSLDCLEQGAYLCQQPACASSVSSLWYKLFRPGSQSHSGPLFLSFTTPKTPEPRPLGLSCLLRVLPFANPSHAHFGSQPFPSRIVLHWPLTPAWLPDPSTAHRLFHWLHLSGPLNIPALWGCVSERCVYLTVPVRY